MFIIIQKVSVIIQLIIEIIIYMELFTQHLFIIYVWHTYSYENWNKIISIPLSKFSKKEIHTHMNLVLLISL